MLNIIRYSLSIFRYNRTDNVRFVQDQKKSVWFKKQRYHCVYEYPKETLSTDSQADTTTDSSEPTSYAGTATDK